ncbi:alpha/beta hydrolase [Roseobacter denitrificans]|nr:alpha/beta fold hydrolase [Roseobacter denitrificans]AVL52357.1 alpha/beta hydrolase [Roseobacter denitrificans]SFG10247.1 Pimeloyl-ACP methyl ester carboxylesterase [Roseobacter denitrificans OCh 114]
MLNVNEFGAPTAPAVMIVHGLYGSARNWGVIAKRLSDGFRVYTVDLRNHGLSPHTQTHSYPEMAADLAETIEHLGGPVQLVGHSMGGKAAMALALTRPDLVHRLLVADIAPVAYTHSQLPFIHAMKAVNLDAVSRRSDAEAQLAAQGVEPALCSFFTQSLDLGEKRWRLNLATLEAEMDKIMSFPQFDTRFDGPTLFLSGAESDYVQPQHRQTIKSLFTRAQFAKLRGAGHWLHADKPREFETAVRSFFAS